MGTTRSRMVDIFLRSVTGFIVIPSLLFTDVLRKIFRRVTRKVGFATLNR
jgi:hypothetical protein